MRTFKNSVTAAALLALSGCGSSDPKSRTYEDNRWQWGYEYVSDVFRSERFRLGEFTQSSNGTREGDAFVATRPDRGNCLLYGPYVSVSRATRGHTAATIELEAKGFGVHPLPDSPHPNPFGQFALVRHIDWNQAGGFDVTFSSNKGQNTIARKRVDLLLADGQEGFRRQVINIGGAYFDGPITDLEVTVCSVSYNLRVAIYNTKISVSYDTN